MSYTVQILYPIWIGIGFNLLMTMATFCVPYHGAFSDWYLDRYGFVKIMVSAWAVFIGWSTFNGLTH